MYKLLTGIQIKKMVTLLLYMYKTLIQGHIDMRGGGLFELSPLPLSNL
mgnify:CR=1 FL=1